MGTPQYMAPEQAAGRIEEVGPSADIYSLGAIMYELLTGRPPFTGKVVQVITEVISRPPVPPRQRRDSIDPALEAICMKCLEKTVERRYKSMGHLAEDLQRFRSGDEVRLFRGNQSSQLVVPGSGSDDNAKTRTWSHRETTEPIPAETTSWWQLLEMSRWEVMDHTLWIDVDTQRNSTWSFGSFFRSSFAPCSVTLVRNKSTTIYRACSASPGRRLRSQCVRETGASSWSDLPDALSPHP